MSLKKSTFKSLLVISVMISMSFLVLSAVSAANHDVNSDSTPTSNVHNNISSAVDTVADNGDVITISAGTYKGNGKNTGIIISKNVTIQSAKYAGRSNQDTVIDGEGLYQIFTIDPDCYVNIYGITFINGKSDYGGAIYSEGNLNIEDSIFKNNIATEYGGGIFCDGDGLNINIKNSRFINNSAFRENVDDQWEESGGAFENFASNSNIYIHDSYFENNKAMWGGAFSNDGEFVNIEILRTTFFNNSAVNDGGAIYNYMDNAYIYIFQSNFEKNLAKGDGGAISNAGDGSEFRIEKSNFTQNTALGSGGAFGEYSRDSTITITESKLKENIASYGASVVSVGVRTILDISYCRITGNSGINFDCKQDSVVTADYNWWGSNTGYLNNDNVTINKYFLMILNTTQKSVKLGNKITYNYYFILNDSSAFDPNRLPYFSTAIFFNGKIVSEFDARYNKTGLSTIINSFNDNITGGADNQRSSLKFSVEKQNTAINSQKVSGTYNKTVSLKATLKDSSNKYIVGKYVKFYVNNKYVGQAKTNSNGLATLNYKVTSTGTLQVKYTFEGNENYVSSISTNSISVPKISNINIKNSKAVKGKIITIKSVLINNGPNKASFKVYYKLPKGFVYSKPKVTKDSTVSYNKKTRILTWNLKNLKTSKTSSATLKWKVKAPKKGKYTVNQNINKVSTVKLSSKNAIAVKVK